MLELLDSAGFLFAKRPLAMDEKAAKLITPAARDNLRALAESFAGLSDWAAPAIEAATREYAQRMGIKLGDVAQPLRAALTGRAVSPPVFDVLTVLGREEALGRLADQAEAQTREFTKRAPVKHSPTNAS